MCIYTHCRLVLLRGEDDVKKNDRKKIKKIRSYTAVFFSSVVKKML